MAKRDPFEIYGLTLPQPWASLLICNTAPSGATRRFATRYAVLPWSAEWRGPVMIQAAAEPDAAQVLRKISSTRQLRALGEALLPILYPGGAPEDKTWQDVILMLQAMPGLLPRRAILGRAEIARCREITPELIDALPQKERDLHQWVPGWYAWEFSKRLPLPATTHNGAAGRLWRYT